MKQYDKKIRVEKRRVLWIFRGKKRKEQLSQV